MSRQHEVNLNNNLAELLDGMFCQSQVQPENTDVIAKSPGKRPDISIIGEGRSPVVIEAEYAPALNVEEEAKGRFKTPYLKNQSRPVESVIALIYPETLRTKTNLKSAIAKTRLRYRVFYAKDEPFPKDGYLEGFAHDLADLIHLIAIPRSAFDKAAKDLINSIDSAVSVLENSAAIYLTDEIADLLGLTNAHLFYGRVADNKERELKILQTRRMAGAII